MNTDELRHETLDMLQTVYVLTAHLKQVLAPGADKERALVEQLVKRAQLCRDRVAGKNSSGDVEQVIESAAVADIDLPKLKVVVTEDDPVIRDFVIDVIANQCGHEIVATAATGTEMVREVLRTEPDVVVFDIHLPEMDGLTALHEIAKELAVAAVAITGDRNTQLIKRAIEDNILAYLLKPVDVQQLKFALQVAWARFKEFCALKDENQSLQQNLADRKLIEKAKGVLMKKNRWSEPTAFRALQRTAMNRRVTMVSIARDILNGKELELR
jgi:AmiR/NasT family two-component response regulator